MASTTAQAQTAERPLLAPDDPPAVERLNPEGRARLLLICDHASNRVPRRLDGLGVAPEVLEQHVAYDIGAADVARRLAAKFGAPLVLSGFSRLVIDCNRPLDDPTSIPVVSDNVVIPANEELREADTMERASACFRPYHDTIGAQLSRMTERDGAPPALVSIHSFTPSFGGFDRPWQVGVLWNEDGRLALPFMDALGNSHGVNVGDNEPYSARENFGYSMREHGEARGVPHLLIEIRQDLIEDRPGVEAWSAIVGTALESALETLSL